MSGKNIAFDGGKWMVVEFEMRVAKKEEQEEQWPSPTRQQKGLAAAPVAAAVAGTGNACLASASPC